MPTAKVIGEIERFAFGEIKSIPQPDKVGFRRETISPTEGGHEKKNDISLARYDIRLAPHDIFADANMI